MNIQRPLFDTDDDEAIARARESIKNGQGVPHEDVADWLERKIKDPSLRMPPEWLK